MYSFIQRFTENWFHHYSQKGCPCRAAATLWS